MLLATVLFFPNRGVGAIHSPTVSAQSGERFGDSYEVGGAASAYGGEPAAAADGIVSRRATLRELTVAGVRQLRAPFVGPRQHRGRRRCEGVLAWWVACSAASGRLGEASSRGGSPEPRRLASLPRLC
jgi:hypothetical protein